MEKIRDAAILANRIGDLKIMYSKILSNHPLAATYLDATEQIRNKNAVIESLYNDYNAVEKRLQRAYDEREVDP